MDIELLEKAVNDEALGIADQGVLLHFFFKGPQKKAGLPVILALHLNELIQGGYLTADADHYFIPGMGPEESDLNDIWAAFYKAYPGVKKGKIEFTKFKAKYPKGKWKVILRTLPGHLQRQIEQRKSKEIAILMQETHQNRHHGMFIPSWKNLQTYINQQGWEEEYLIPEQYASKATERAGAENGHEEFDVEYRRYYFWSLSEGKKFVDNVQVIETQILSEKEYLDVVHGKEAPFKDFDLYCTLQQLKMRLAEWQMKYFGEVYLRQKYSKFWDYLCSEFRREYKSQ
jgi:hypothetical protein